ncbi:PEP-utilizing enzyme [Fusobacteria bacterium ZRK30]|nr:PEP-utilizing enzyme [Fusobacteria bacterium ZRK30]
MKKLIYHFDTVDIVKLSEVGGKAKSLIETTRAGLNVPDGFVLTVEFFSSWVENLKKNEIWDEFLKDPSRENCERLKKIAANLKFTEDQIKILEGAKKRFRGDSIFAVRSSSPEEDLEGTSFAGMYETSLGVTGENLKDNIKTAFASMLDTRVVEYKKIQEMSMENPEIAIIIQRQISSEISGVAFSLNPQNNCYDETYINASFGLGESIVSGQVTPDSYVVEKVQRKIMEKRISEKKTGLWLKEEGGIVEKEIEDKDAPALTDEEILLVSDLVSRCENHYGFPVDIEWAVAKGELYLLQARPITSYLPIYEEMMTQPGERKILYMDLTVLTQGFSENISILGLEIWGKMVDAAKGGLMPVGKDGAVINIHGRQYMNISNYLKLMGGNRTTQLCGNYDKPTRMIFESINLKEEYEAETLTPKMKKVKSAILRQVFRMSLFLIKGLYKEKKLVREYLEKGEEVYQYAITKVKNDRSFDVVIDEAFKEFEGLIKPAYIIMLGISGYSKIKKMFKGMGLDDEIVSLSMDLQGNPTSKMGREMLRLASFDEVQKVSNGKEFAEKLSRNEFSKEFMVVYEEYIHRYGARGFKEIDIAAPRSYENPKKFFTQLKALNIHDNVVLTVKERKQRAYNKLLAKAEELGKKKKFIKYAEIYDETMGYREHPKYIYVIINDALRKVALEIGEQFKYEGRLKFIDQIFDLTIKQIREAQNNKEMNLQDIIEKNLKMRKSREHIKEWPKIIDSRGKVFRYIRESKEGDLVGDPISPGVIRGRAKVLNSPYEKSLEKGEILVARATEPAWTPIFVNASGVVMEIGGPLQHGAIIAREYGIPCVSGIHKATGIIKDGDLLEVDGSSGIVRIIEE